MSGLLSVGKPRGELFFCNNHSSIMFAVEAVVDHSSFVVSYTYVVSWLPVMVAVFAVFFV